MNSGPKHWNAKLSDLQIAFIRASKLPTRVLAEHYKVNPRYVRKVRAGFARKVIRI